MQDKSSTGMGSSEEIDKTGYLMNVINTPVLPTDHLYLDESTSFPCIEGSVLVKILQGEYDWAYDNRIVIDCRFEYEYVGGHIQGAKNYWTRNMIDTHLFHNQPLSGKTLIVLHCEYSECRAPHMAMYIRSRDRRYNETQYPQLTYPTICILKGGYRSFYSDYATLCEPHGYISERDEYHANKGKSVRSDLESRKRYKDVRTGKRRVNLKEKFNSARAKRTQGHEPNHCNRQAKFD